MAIRRSCNINGIDILVMHQLFDGFIDFRHVVATSIVLS